MADPIELQWQGDQATLVLNQPERANVLDAPACAALAQAARTLAQRAAEGRLRAVLLRGSGPLFCAGGDIQDFVQAGDALPALLARNIPPLHEAIHTLATLPVPVVSAVNGPLGGGGIGLALLADIVLAADTAKLRGGYAAIGLAPDVGVSWLLTRLVGPMQAKRILMTPRSFSASECLALGLYAEVYPAAELLPAAEQLVATLAAGATVALACIKAEVDGAAQRSLRDQLALEHAGMVRCGSSADAAEGVRAFLEKRPARFGGQP